MRLPKLPYQIALAHNGNPVKIPTYAKATPPDRVTLIAYSSLHLFTSSHPLPDKDSHIHTSHHV
ncbi:hypothetical protein L873DRAFT_1804562 [Choiromyces venosus 120613-1]|uniref:Uncharacterized protein n=1 Tax=Choiromyces venosus 120613-1 TaxID=1336337 RepID=A0A3N4JR89_9PEZI|nr:hypothetical protein L873DRAFT_1804562 [Choiromyces venosus 120613-1]